MARLKNNKNTSITNLIHQRKSGVLLHLSSLPGPYSCGDMGQSAYDFLDFLKRSGQTWWQTLPINPIGSGNSPYSSVSTLAGETLFIGQEGLYESGLLRKSELKKNTNRSSRANYSRACAEKQKLLRLAFTRLEDRSKSDKYVRDLEKFIQTECSWLRDYTLFTILSSEYGNQWTKWPLVYRRRDSKSLIELEKSFVREIKYISFCQYEFFRQWSALRQAAKEQGIWLMGDIPIFVSHHSADVWSNQKIFFLNKDGTPSYVAGCPPDKFCPDGQLWGNALYNWKSMKADGFSWWMTRFAALFSMYDAVRLDHFIGFYNYWKIPAHASSAKTGKWERADGEALFKTLSRKMGTLPLLAEDLGRVTSGVWKLRDQFGFPGMKVVQFGFAVGDNLNVHKLQEIPAESITYTGTHDNDTAVGWYQSCMKEKPAKHEREAIREVFDTPRKVGEDMIRLGSFCKSNIFMFPVQDILNLDSRSRMNIPGTPKGNWEFRLTDKLFSQLRERESFLRELAMTSGRL